MESACGSLDHGQDYGVHKNMHNNNNINMYKNKIYMPPCVAPNVGWATAAGDNSFNISDCPHNGEAHVQERCGGSSPTTHDSQSTAIHVNTNASTQTNLHINNTFAFHMHKIQKHKSTLDSDDIDPFELVDQDFADFNDVDPWSGPYEMHDLIDETHANPDDNHGQYNKSILNNSNTIVSYNSPLNCQLDSNVVDFSASNSQSGGSGTATNRTESPICAKERKGKDIYMYVCMYVCMYFLFL